MPGVKCPQCGLYNLESAQRCDCGWNFETHTPDQVYAAPQRQTPAVWSVLIFMGIVALVTTAIAQLPVVVTVVLGAVVVVLGGCYWSMARAYKKHGGK